MIWAIVSKDYIYTFTVIPFLFESVYWKTCDPSFSLPKNFSFILIDILQHPLKYHKWLEKYIYGLAVVFRQKSWSVYF